MDSYFSYLMKWLMICTLVWGPILLFTANTFSFNLKRRLRKVGPLELSETMDSANDVVKEATRVDEAMERDGNDDSILTV